MRRRLTILGSTGSIGLQALDVVRSHRERFDIVGLSAGGNAKAIKEQAEEFKPSYVALESRDANALDGLGAQKITGPGASATLAESPSPTKSPSSPAATGSWGSPRPPTTPLTA